MVSGNIALADGEPDNPFPGYSFITTVYEGTNIAGLHVCIDSMAGQTVPPSEFIIVVDGPVGNVLHECLDEYAQKELFKVIRLKQNCGPAIAAQVGIEACAHDLIARLDADDRAYSYRIERQMGVFAENPLLGLVGSWVLEVNGEKGSRSLVELPVTDEDIQRFARRRCPVRQSTLLLRKEALDRIEGYRDLRFAEDWDLCNRLIEARVPLCNIPEVLVEMETGDDFFSRRGGRDKLAMLFRFKTNMLLKRNMSISDYIISMGASLVVCLVPNRLRECIYRMFLRRKASDG